MGDLPKHVILKHGDWYVRVSIPTDRKDSKGRPMYDQVLRKCFPETPERAAEIVNFLKYSTEEIQAAIDSPTVGDFLTSFLESKSDVSLRTHHHYSELYAHIKDAPFARVPLSDVTPSIAQRYIDQLRKQVSPDMVRRLHSFLSMAFKYAVIWKQIPENPMKGLILPKVDRDETLAMSNDEVKRFLAACTDEYIIFEFALETGLRPQECLALMWSDVDLNKRTCRVRRALVEIKGRLSLSEPKTRTSRRTVAFSEHLAEKLLRHKERQRAWRDRLQDEAERPLLLEHKKMRGANYEKRRLHRATVKEILENLTRLDLVFPASNGGLQSRNNLNRRQFKELLTLAGIDPNKYSVKHLRHTNASLLAHKINPKHLQKRLGHSQVATTLRFYTHVQEDEDAKFVDEFAKEFY